MKNPIITAFEKKKGLLKESLPDIRSGDSVKVHYKIKESGEGDKEKFRIQIFEGVVLRRRRGTTGSSVTVRKISAGGIGVERVFPMHSPFVEKIEILSRGVVRRSRLYYLRDLAGKAARIRSQFAAKDTSGTGTNQAAATETAEDSSLN